MEKNTDNTNRTLRRILRLLTSPLTWTALAITVAAVCVCLLIIYSRDNSVGIVRNNKIDISPTMVKSIEDIGQWEFLAINDEELIDTVRHGFFGDDVLARIYVGTLRIGIDTHEAKPGWIALRGDTVVITMPPIKLLDHNFIDEAQTRPIYENGKWSHKAKAEMYKRAYDAMKRRCLNDNNMDRARQNATAQMTSLIRSTGLNNVKVVFEEDNRK